MLPMTEVSAVPTSRSPRTNVLPMRVASLRPLGCALMVAPLVVIVSDELGNGKIVAMLCPMSPPAVPALAQPLRLTSGSPVLEQSVARLSGHGGGKQIVAVVDFPPHALELAEVAARVAAESRDLGKHLVTPDGHSLRVRRSSHRTRTWALDEIGAGAAVRTSARNHREQQLDGRTADSEEPHGFPLLPAVGDRPVFGCGLSSAWVRVGEIEPVQSHPCVGSRRCCC